MWERLRCHIERYETEEFRGGWLRVAAVDAILNTEAEMQPPMWLTMPFGPLLSPDASSTSLGVPDVPALIRVYMLHRRFEDAAGVTVRYLSVVADTVPSVAMPRPGAVCVPHSLVVELAGCLPPGSRACKILAQTICRVQDAASRQTQFLEESSGAGMDLVGHGERNVGV